MNSPGEEYETQGSCAVYVRKSCHSCNRRSWSHFHTSSTSMSSLKHRAMYITAAWESFCRGMWQIGHPVILRISTLCCHPHSFNHLLHVGRSAPGKFLSPCQQSWRVSQWLQALPGSWWTWAPHQLLALSQGPIVPHSGLHTLPFWWGDGVKCSDTDEDNATPLSLHGVAPLQGVLCTRENCLGLLRGPLWGEVETAKNSHFPPARILLSTWISRALSAFQNKVHDAQPRVQFLG